MTFDAFSRCHPAVNFLFFAAAIGCGMVIQHPAYILAGVVCGGMYYCLLYGRRGLPRIAGMLLLPILTAVLNPLLNHRGKHVLFLVMGKSYTLEALCYGLALGGIFLVMLLWFGCYSAVLTSDKFTSLFGSIIPSLSLLLVMVLRLIPAFTRKTKQVLDARRAIGMGAEQTGSLREKTQSGPGGEHYHRRFHAGPGLRLRKENQLPAVPDDETGLAAACPHHRAFLPGAPCRGHRRQLHPGNADRAPGLGLSRLLCPFADPHDF